MISSCSRQSWRPSLLLEGRWTEKRHHSIFRLIHDTAAAIHDVSFSFEVAMTETDWMLPVVYRWSAGRLCGTELSMKLARLIGEATRRSRPSSLPPQNRGKE